MRRPNHKVLLVVAALGGMAYPILVYFGLPFVTPFVFVLVASGLIGLRLLVMRGNRGDGDWTISLMIAGLGLIIIAAVDTEMAVKAYPVVISLTAAGVFAASLLFPPTVVERFARLSDSNPTPAVIAYTRKVTAIWSVFLGANAAIAAATGLWGSLEQWTLWNGLISYLLMGALFIGEYAVRHLVRRRT